MAAAANAAARPGTLRRLLHLYQVNIIQQERSGRFLISVSFLLAFLAVRGITHAIKDQKLTFLFHNASAGGAHIHHLVYGIIGLLLAGYFTIGFNPQRLWARRTLAITYGIAAALTLDEFALWLRLKDVYWERQGRASVDAVVIVAALFFLTLEGHSLWRALGHDIAWLLRGGRGEPPPPRGAPQKTPKS